MTFFFFFVWQVNCTPEHHVCDFGLSQSRPTPPTLAPVHPLRLLREKLCYGPRTDTFDHADSLCLCPSVSLHALSTRRTPDLLHCSNLRTRTLDSVNHANLLPLNLFSLLLTESEKKALPNCQPVYRTINSIPLDSESQLARQCYVRTYKTGFLSKFRFLVDIIVSNFVGANDCVTRTVFHLKVATDRAPVVLFPPPRGW